MARTPAISTAAPPPPAETDQIAVVAAGHRRDIYRYKDAIMTTLRTIVIDGEELVALTRADYEALLARAGDGAAEDAMTRRIVTAAAEHEAFPDAVFARIDAGENPIKVLRDHRNMTQVQLAAATGVAQGYISGLEGGQRTGTAHTLLKIAKALQVPLDMLVGEEEGAELKDGHLPMMDGLRTAIARD